MDTGKFLFYMRMYIVFMLLGIAGGYAGNAPFAYISMVISGFALLKMIDEKNKSKK